MIQLTVGCYAETWDGQKIGPMVENKAANKEDFPFSAKARIGPGTRESWCFWTAMGTCSRTPEGGDPGLDIRSVWFVACDFSEEPDETKIIVARPDGTTYVPQATPGRIVILEPTWKPEGDPCPRPGLVREVAELRRYSRGSIEDRLDRAARREAETKVQRSEVVINASDLPRPPSPEEARRWFEKAVSDVTRRAVQEAMVPGGMLSPRPCGEVVLGGPQKTTTEEAPPPPPPAPARPHRAMDQMRPQDFQRGVNNIWSSFRLLP